MWAIVGALIGPVLQAIITPLFGYLMTLHNQAQAATVGADQTAIAVSDANAKAQAAIAQAEADAPSTAAASEAAMQAGAF